MKPRVARHGLPWVLAPSRFNLKEVAQSATNLPTTPLQSDTMCFRMTGTHVTKTCPALIYLEEVTS
jgi:hypothetical protein